MTSSESYIFLAVVAGLALVALIYLLSPMSLLEDITSRGAEIRARLQALLYRHEYSADNKTAMLIGYVDIALEHHKAIWLLTDAQLNGSAFALVRLVYDALLRALWINKVATEEQVEQATRDELKFPPMRALRDDIKKAYFGDAQPEEAGTGDKFLQMLKEIWRASSSYTHSGALQIGRRFTGDKVKPNYSEGNIIQALSLATVAVLLLLHMFFVSMGHYEEVEEIQTLLRQHHTDFGPRLRSGH